MGVVGVVGCGGLGVVVRGNSLAGMGWVISKGEKIRGYNLRSEGEHIISVAGFGSISNRQEEGIIFRNEEAEGIISAAGMEMGIISEEERSEF